MASGTWWASAWSMGAALSPRLREAVLRFDPLVADESVVMFCHRLGIGTSTFYRLRERGRQQGVAAALVPASRAPLHPSRRYDAFTDEAISQLREQLLEEGYEAGPWSIWWRLFQAGVAPLPSRSTIARRLRALGLVEPCPRKRPRSSWHRFARSRANELWQLDGIEWRIDEAPVTIYQIHDDCTRMLVALNAAAGGETSVGARGALQAGFDGYGMPAAVLTDNGRAFNQHRLGHHSSTETWLASLGIRPISGSVRHPQTQGKVERAHQPVQRWLERRAITSLEELNHQLGVFQRYYNTERQHQALGLGITPLMAWTSIGHDQPANHPIPLELLYGRQPRSLPPAPISPILGDRRVGTNGRIAWASRIFHLGIGMAGQAVHIIHTTSHVEIYDHDGVEIGRIPWPQPASTRAISLTKPPFRTPSPKS